MCKYNIHIVPWLREEIEITYLGTISVKEEGDDDNAFYDVLPLSEVEVGSTNQRQRCSRRVIFRM